MSKVQIRRGSESFSDAGVLTPAQQKAATEHTIRLVCIFTAVGLATVFALVIVFSTSEKVDLFAKYLLPLIGTMVGYSVGSRKS